MPHQTKIATCSYCGRRQTLRLSAREGHELACGACGAPIHEMKWLKPPEARGEVKRSAPMQAPHGHRPEARRKKDDWSRKARKKKKKPVWKKALGEAFDIIEDIFD